MFFREMGDKIPEDTPIQHEWVSADEMAPSLALAVVCTEDQRFLTHHGFDWESIQQAYEDSENGGKSRGASTISQQTAKNVFCWPTSSFIRKAPETWFTVLIETFWSKDRILEVYLNSVEFGPGIYGAEAASQHFFEKSAIELNNTQCARLAVVLPNPLEMKANATSGKVVSRKDYALRQMANYGYDLELTRVNGEEEEEEDDDNSAKQRK
jgi:monofunctional biosynthetic peptidoglycan transglycosylase